MRSDADEASARGDIAAAGGGALKLLVPLDGSAASQRALEYALGLAAAHPASGLVLLNVQTGDELGLWDPQARGDDERFAAARRSQKVLRRPFETCRERHLRCEVRAEYGDAVAETIVRIARETGADQIVMGARGLGRLRGLILGSVTTQVVHLADIPVTLVKARPRHRLNS
ncbi:MAG TPA: universal stress protein [Stellaceae bacterium]|nr:universal stress protein [Stellaceae bacterium]